MLREEYFIDADTIHIDDLEIMGLGRDDLTRFRKSLEAVHDIAREGGVFGGVFFDDFFLEELVDLVDEGFSIDEVRASLRRYDIAFSFFVLIGEVSDDDFDEVMEGDDPFGAAVFVFDDGDILFFLFKSIEDLDSGRGLGDEERFWEYFFERKSSIMIVLEEIFYLEDTHHRIEWLICDEQSWVHAFLYLFKDHLSAIIDIDPVDLISVGDDGFGALIRKWKYIVMKWAFISAEDSLLTSGFQVGDELLFTDFFFAWVLDAKDAEDEGRREGEELHERVGDEHKILQYRHTEEGEWLGMIHGDGLWDELSDDDRKVGNPTDSDDEGEAIGISSDDGDLLEGQSEARGDSGSPISTRDDADEGDANLDRRKEILGVFEEFEHDFCALVSFRCEVFHLTFFRRYECDLG